MFDEILFAVGRTDQKDQILKIAANLVIQSQHNLCLTSKPGNLNKLCAWVGVREHPQSHAR